MASQSAEQAAANIDPAEVRHALERVLGSKHFVNAYKKQKFLRLVCDYYLNGRAHELNEYLLGYEVFDRDNTYNPSADPVVRVIAHEIRKKLELYYQHEGAADAVRLELPAGSYHPIFTRHAPTPAVEVAPEELSAPPRVEDATLLRESEAARSRRRLPPATLWLSAAVLVLTSAVIFLAVNNRELRQAAVKANTPRDATTFGEVWGPFLKDSVPPLVVLSNPPVLRLANPSDPEPLLRESIRLSPENIEMLKNRFVLSPEVIVRRSPRPADETAPNNGVVVRQNRPPRLIISTNSHTGLGEAIGLHYLTGFFHAAGKTIVLKQSRTLSAEDLKSRNVVMLGGVWVNEWSGKLTQQEDFGYTNYGTIVNRSPQAGEQHEYIPQFDERTGSLLVDYAIITVKPNISDSNSVMMLAGIYSAGTEAAAEYVTSKNYLEQLRQSLGRLKAQSQPPRSFQVLLKVGVENGIPTTISILALHELRGSQP